MDFIAAAIFVRYSYDFIPITPKCLLMTLCSSTYYDVSYFLEETDDPLDLSDALMVLEIISTRTKVPASRVAYRAQLISPLSVYNYDGHLIIKNMRTRNLNELE